MRVDNSARSRRIIRISLVLYYVKVYCVFLLESPQRGDSNEYIQNTVFNIKKKITLNYPKSAAKGVFFKGLKNEFETGVIDELSATEVLLYSKTAL